MEDFISWDDDDINLDLLLGEYIDYENEKCSENKVTSSSVYVCPACKKELRSISGFRGHVSKKHGLDKVKASDHRKGDKQSTEKQSTEKVGAAGTPQDSSVTSLIPETVYCSIFPNAYNQALSVIISDPLHNLFGPSPISEIASFCMENIEFKEQMKAVFAEVVSKPINMTLAGDRERLFSEIHTLRLSAEIAEICNKLHSSRCPQPESVNNFVQIFILECINKLFHYFCETMRKASKTAETAISENDQKLLFYISGFIVRTLLKRYSKLQKSSIRDQKLDYINNLHCEQSNSNTLNKLATWLEKKDRGGLKRPHDDFFFDKEHGNSREERHWANTFSKFFK